MRLFKGRRGVAGEIVGGVVGIHQLATGALAEGALAKAVRVFVHLAATGIAGVDGGVEGRVAIILFHAAVDAVHHPGVRNQVTACRISISFHERLAVHPEGAGAGEGVVGQERLLRNRFRKLHQGIGFVAAVVQEAEGLGRFKEDVHVGHVGVIDIQLLAVEDFKVSLAQVQAIPVLRGKVLRRKGDDKGPAGHWNMSFTRMWPERSSSMSQ